MSDCCQTSTSIYERLGGEPAIARLVSRLYDVMGELPEAQYIWKWHPADMDDVKARVTSFLCGWLGGPATYPERYGPPMMRRRHMSFPIGPQERDIWLKCARTALDETVADVTVREQLYIALAGMADHMRNLRGDGQSEGCNCNCGGHS